MRRTATLFFAVIICCSLLLCGCGAKTPSPEASAKTMFDEIMRINKLSGMGIEYYSETDESMYFFDSDLLSGKYGVLSECPDIGKMKSYAAFFSFDNYGIEFGIFKMDSEESAAEMKTFIEARKTKLLNNAVNYPSVDTSLWDNCVIKTDQCWVYYICAENNAVIVETIEKELYSD